MEHSKEQFIWKKWYSAVLIANAAYILFFYWITNSFS